jgi:uncharacterized protein YciI
VLSILQKARETKFASCDMSALFPFRKQGAEKNAKKYFAVLLPMLDEEKSRIYRPDHLAYLAEMRGQGHIFVNGKFGDGSGGLIIYKAGSFEEVVRLAENDPYVMNLARSYEIHEWDIVW